MGPQIRRLEMRALCLNADPMHHAGAYFTTALQRAGHRLQECVAAFHRHRGGGHDGIEFGIG